MEEKIFNFVETTFGIAFAAGVLVLAVAFWLVYYITHHVTCIKKDHSILENNVQKTESHIDEIRRDLSYIKGSLDIMKSGAPTLMKSNSPISLTEEGRKVAQEMAAETLIAQSWDKISRALMQVKEKSAYDIQEFCIETSSVDPHLFFEPPVLEAIKNFAFNKGLPLQLYLRLLGVLIRDKYFQEQGISLHLIDETDPNKK